MKAYSRTIKECWYFRHLEVNRNDRTIKMMFWQEKISAAWSKRWSVSVFSLSSKGGMEAVLVDVRFWPLSWAGFFLVRRAVRTSYQFLLNEIDIFVTGRPRTHSLTRIKTNLRSQGEKQQQTSNLNTIKFLKCFLPVKSDGELEKKLKKNSHLSPAIQNRVFFFCLNLLTVLERIMEVFGSVVLWGLLWGGQMSAFASTTTGLAESGTSHMFLHGHMSRSTWWHWSQQAALCTANKES